MDTKECIRCHKVKPLGDFGRRYEPNKRQYPRSMCKRCESERGAIRLKTTKRGVICQRLKSARARAKAKGLVYELDAQWAFEQIEKQQWLCAATGDPMTIHDPDEHTCVSVDRIDSKKGYTKDNVQFVTSRFNLMKGDFTYEEIIDMARKLAGQLSKPFPPA